ncbi:insulinase family protein [Vibrio penaeicida]|uniref:insulinase family protein n=1 Tax=Vibrio penaeicida TaxID=104609 RepID=UPI000CE9D6EF|nr:insulinase family protein [Vibrio penaeicida]
MSNLSFPPFKQTKERVTPKGDVWLCWEHPSGLRHWHCSNLYRSNPEPQFSASVMVKTPSYDDCGVTHAVEHMVLRGCYKYPDSHRFWQLRSSLGLVEFNATTRRGNTRFHLSGSHKDNAFLGLDYFVHSTLCPLLTEREWQADNHDGTYVQRGELSALYQELQGYENNEHFQQACAVAKEFNYPLYSGSAKNISRLSLPEIRQYYWYHYRPEYFCIVTAGNWNLTHIWQSIVTALAYRKSEEPEKIPLTTRWIKSAQTGSCDCKLTLKMSDKKAVQIYKMLSEGHIKSTLDTLGYQLLPLTTMLDPKPTIRMKSANGEYDELITRYLSMLASQWTQCQEAKNIWFQYCMERHRDTMKKWGESLTALYLSNQPLTHEMHMPKSQTEPIGDWLPEPVYHQTVTIFARLPKADTNLYCAYETWIQELIHYVTQHFKTTPHSVAYHEQTISGVHSDIHGLSIHLSCSALIFWQHFDDHFRQHEPPGFMLNLLKSEQVIFMPVDMPHSDADRAQREPFVRIEQNHDSVRMEFRLPRSVSTFHQCAAVQWIMQRRSVIEMRLNGQLYSISSSIKPELNALEICSHFDKNPHHTRRILCEEIQAFNLKHLSPSELQGVFHGARGLMASQLCKHQPEFYKTAYRLLGISLEMPEAVGSSGLAFTFAMWKTALVPYLKAKKKK